MLRNEIAAVVGLLALSACAPEAPAQQETAPQPAVARIAPPADTRERAPRAAPKETPVPDDSGEATAKQKIDEITERLEYTRRYIGPPEK